LKAYLRSLHLNGLPSYTIFGDEINRSLWINLDVGSEKQPLRMILDSTRAQISIRTETIENSLTFTQLEEKFEEKHHRHDAEGHLASDVISLAGESTNITFGVIEFMEEFGYFGWGDDDEDGIIHLTLIII